MSCKANDMLLPFWLQRFRIEAPSVHGSKKLLRAVARVAVYLSLLLLSIDPRNTPPWVPLFTSSCCTAVSVLCNLRVLRVSQSSYQSLIAEWIDPFGSQSPLSSGSGAKVLTKGEAGTPAYPKEKKRQKIKRKDDRR